MAKRIISTQEAPAALGFYSQATATDTTLYCSGQIGIRPDTGELEHGVEAQARQAFRNLEAVIAEADRSTAQVMKLTIFLASIDDFAVVNRVMGEFFEAPYPASPLPHSRRAPSSKLKPSLILLPNLRFFGR